MNKKKMVRRKKKIVRRKNLSLYLSRKEVQISNINFVYALERAIEFHRNNTNDPHNVGNAVVVALSEVKDAFKAYIC